MLFKEELIHLHPATAGLLQKKIIQDKVPPLEVEKITFIPS
jgi:hypothetical protein